MALAGLVWPVALGVGDSTVPDAWGYSTSLDSASVCTQGHLPCRPGPEFRQGFDPAHLSHRPRRLPPVAGTPSVLVGQKHVLAGPRAPPAPQGPAQDRQRQAQGAKQQTSPQRPEGAVQGPQGQALWKAPPLPSVQCLGWSCAPAPHVEPCSAPPPQLSSSVTLVLWDGAPTLL